MEYHTPDDWDTSYEVEQPLDKTTAHIEKLHDAVHKQYIGQDVRTCAAYQHALVNAHNDGWQREYRLLRGETVKSYFKTRGIEDAYVSPDKIAGQQPSKKAGRPEVRVYYVTVNPRQKFDGNAELHLDWDAEFERAAEDAARKASTYYYVFEQRKPHSADASRGYHMHALYLRPSKTTASNFRAGIHTSFDRFCGSKNHVHIKPVTTMEYLNNLKRYMAGDKTGKDEGEKLIKADRVREDEIWREANNLFPDYTNEHDKPTEDQFENNIM